MIAWLKRGWAVLMAPSPAHVLAGLEERALGLGMSDAEMTNLRDIGNCPAQTRERIHRMTEWIRDREQQPEGPEISPGIPHTPTQKPTPPPFQY